MIVSASTEHMEIAMKVAESDDMPDVRHLSVDANETPDGSETLLSFVAHRGDYFVVISLPWLVMDECSSLDLVADVIAGCIAGKLRQQEDSRAWKEFQEVVEDGEKLEQLNKQCAHGTITDGVNELMETVAEINTANGWREFDNDATYMGLPPEIAKLLRVNTKLARHALIHSEVSELLEYARMPDGSPDVMSDHIDMSGEAEECADTVIRVADYADIHNIDLAEAINLKLAYNRTRGYKHGNKRA